MGSHGREEALSLQQFNSGNECFETALFLQQHCRAYTHEWVLLSCPSQENGWPGFLKGTLPLPTSHLLTSSTVLCSHSDISFLNGCRPVMRRGLIIISMLLLLCCKQQPCARRGCWELIPPALLPSLLQHCRWSGALVNLGRSTHRKEENCSTNSYI